LEDRTAESPVEVNFIHVAASNQTDEVSGTTPAAEMNSSLGKKQTGQLPHFLALYIV
jgi:hypothetical protein